MSGIVKHLCIGLLVSLLVAATNQAAALNAAATTDGGGPPDDKGYIAITKVMPQKTIFLGEDAHITATVYDKDGNPVGRGHTVDWYLDGDGPGDSETGDDGSVTYTYSSSKQDEPDTHTITAEVSADDYKPNTASSNIRVVEGDLALSISDDAVKAGHSVTLTGRINDHGANTDLTGETISFSAKVRDDPSAEWEDAGSPWPVSGATDAGGKTAITSPTLAAKYYQITAHYNDKTDKDQTMGVSVSIAKTDTADDWLLDPGILCLNAQDEYKKTKYTATIVPQGASAKVEVTDASKADVHISPSTATSGSDEANPHAAEITVSGDKNSTPGTYAIKITQTKAKDATATSGQGTAFKFVWVLNFGEYPEVRPLPDDNNGTFGTAPPFATPPYAGGTYNRDHVDDTYTENGYGDNDLDFTGQCHIYSATDKHNVLNQGRILESKVASQGQTQHIDHFIVGTKPVQTYTGNLQMRLTGSYNASTHWNGAGLSGQSFGLNYGFLGFGFSLTYSTSGDVACHTAIALSVDGSVDRHDRGHTISTTPIQYVSGNYTVQASTVSASKIYQMTTGYISVSARSEVGCQSVRHTHKIFQQVSNHTDVDNDVQIKPTLLRIHK